MAITGMIARRLGWLLLTGAVLVLLSGCTQRDEGNPFIGPYGHSLTQPFG